MINFFHELAISLEFLDVLFTTVVLLGNTDTVVLECLWSVVLKLQSASELPGSFIMYRLLSNTAVISDSMCGAQDPSICVSNKFPDDGDATGHHFGKHCFR